MTTGFAAERRAVELAIAEIMAARHPGTTWVPHSDTDTTTTTKALSVRIGDGGSAGKKESA